MLFDVREEKMKTKITATICTAIAIATVGVAEGTVIIQYQGTITSGGGPLGRVGDLFAVVLKFPTTLVDTNPDSGFGPYALYGTYRAFGSSAYVNASYLINGNTLSVSTSNYFDIFVGDSDSAHSGSDSFEVEAFIGPTSGGSTFFNLFMVDTTKTALDSDRFPTTLDLADFTTTGSNLFIDGSSYFGRIDSFSYVIPEPTAGIMLVCTALPTLLRRRRTRRAMQPLPAS